MPRCFVAIELPEDVLRRLDLLRPDLPGARPVPASQLHLTLSFLGTVDRSLLLPLIHLLGQLHVQPFSIHFAGSGYFPDHRHPRVCWIGLAPEPHLQALAGLIRSAVLSCGIPQERSTYFPHITLARFRVIPPAGTVPIPVIPADEKLPSVAVREFTLFESTLSSHGAEHTVIRRFSLQMPARSRRE